MVIDRITLLRNLILFSGFVFLISCKKPASSSSSSGMPVGCEEFRFDLTDGTMNGVKPNLNQAEIKEWIPCFSRSVPDGTEGDCGGGVFYDAHSFAFYTYGYDYVEVKKGFAGPGKDTLFKKNRSEVRKMLGIPVQSEISKAYPEMDLFTADYGCIRVEYQNDLPVLYGAHYFDCENLDWCGREK
jgi:hypothetical protein